MARNRWRTHIRLIQSVWSYRGPRAAAQTRWAARWRWSSPPFWVSKSSSITDRGGRHHRQRTRRPRPADGYTLLLPTVTAAINPTLHRKLPYDTVKDFAPVILLASAPYVLAINPSVPARSVAELIEFAKSKPRQLNFASTGNGSAPHLTGEWFNQASGTSFVHVPYKGGPPVLTDLLGGHVQMAFGNIVSYLPLARAGKLRVLAVTSAKRSPQAPELPTMIESGLPGFVTGTWFGVQTPVRTPSAINSRLNRALNELLAGQLPKRLANEGADPIGGSAKEFADYLQSELVRWAEVVRAANIKVD